MEQKMASSTSSEISAASSAHYAAENQIMDAVRGMSLKGKQKLASQMPDHCANCEKMA